MVVELTDDNFSKEVLESNEVVLVDFWATWCGPCRMLAPTIEELSCEYEGKIKVCKLNVDDNPKAASNFGIRSIPTLLIFKGGKIQENIIGAQPKDAIKSKIDSILVK